jgi:hypothetical protein
MVSVGSWSVARFPSPLDTNMYKQMTKNIVTAIMTPHFVLPSSPPWVWVPTVRISRASRDRFGYWEAHPLLYVVVSPLDQKQFDTIVMLSWHKKHGDVQFQDIPLFLPQSWEERGCRARYLCHKYLQVFTWRVYKLKIQLKLVNDAHETTVEEWRNTRHYIFHHVQCQNLRST